MTPAGQEQPLSTGTPDGFSSPASQRLARIGLAVDQVPPTVDLLGLLNRLDNDPPTLALIDQLTEELTRARKVAADLSIALDSNRAIGAATGILMARHQVTQPQAFDLLRVASQNRHVKLREIAREVVETGALAAAPAKGSAARGPAAGDPAG